MAPTPLSEMSEMVEMVRKWLLEPEPDSEMAEIAEIKFLKSWRILEYVKMLFSIVLQM